MTTTGASEASRSDETPKSGTPEQWARLEQYRTTVSRGGGLTLHGWDDFDRLERHLDRPAYEARMEEGRRRSRMETARDLSSADLRTIIAEKEPLAQFALEQVAIRMQMRVDAITERGGETVGISLGFAREIVRAINAVCNVSDGDRNGEDRNRGLSAEHASAVGSGADETPTQSESFCSKTPVNERSFFASAETPHPHPPTDKGVGELAKKLARFADNHRGVEGRKMQVEPRFSTGDLTFGDILDAATDLERLTRERDEAQEALRFADENRTFQIARAEASEAREASLKAALDAALADRELQSLIESLRPYVTKKLGSLRIDIGEVQKIVSFYDAARALTTKEASDA